jgi:hypothetical protein
VGDGVSALLQAERKRPATATIASAKVRKEKRGDVLELIWKQYAELSEGS